MPGVSEPSGRAETEKLLYQFDNAWQLGNPPRIEDYLKAHAAIPLTRTPLPPGERERGRREFLEELVKIDLEYRWRRKLPGNSPWSLEEYVTRYPELGRLDSLS